MEVICPQEAMELVKAYVAFLDKTDPGRLIRITSKIFLENQHESKDIQKIRLSEGLFNSLVEDASRFSSAIKKPKKNLHPPQNYNEILHAKLKEVKKSWLRIFLEKLLSSEDLRHFRKSFKKIVALQKSDLAEHACQRCRVFLSELKRAEERNLRKKSYLRNDASLMPTPTIKKKGSKNTDNLISKIIKIEPSLQDSQLWLARLSKNQQENLLLSLKTLDPETKEIFLKDTGIEKLLLNSSILMRAVRLNNQDEIKSILGIKTTPMLATTAMHDNLVFEKETLLHIIVAPCVEFNYINQALEKINAKAKFVSCERKREIEKVLRGKENIVVTITGISNHGVQHKINASGRRDILYLEQLNPSTVCQRIVEACLKKSIPLVHKN